ncbi:hypothetical protein J4558_00780 [Leptolyngbya sp. 15MV]|nr:hypothetical protein J4558_00780 [Leptolyngbya sp. 15MV]
MQARDQLDAVRPDAAEDLRVAMNKDRTLIAEAANGKTARAVRAMTFERERRIDVTARADRFVADWQTRARQMSRFEKDGDYLALDKVKSGMAAMSQSLERDPQLESLLRQRHKELGIGTSGGVSISHNLQRWLDRSRSRGRGL